MLLGSSRRWKLESWVRPGGQTNKMAQKKGWSEGLGEGVHRSALVGSTVAVTGCGQSRLLVPDQEARAARFHGGNGKSSSCLFSCAQEGNTRFLKGVMGESKATLK